MKTITLVLTRDQTEALLQAYSIEECQVRTIGSRDAEEVLTEAYGILNEALARPLQAS